MSYSYFYHFNLKQGS